ncbi:low molecular weight protein-tyrosine-phosphatase [Oryzibacter oryziterrae]|uniref:low molecular weight protein-tyrosine-phosphatase n=1 Tax=Oryzibacter oryziterrae TaxID=2766474 RepID=UPI001F3288CA|nr:low molecular weight protein-tyrosine-phosphatase [Oryzibacter oryziterrae]
MPAVLFVCLGNICRSPLAEGVFRNRVRAAGLADTFIIDSAGTGGWHAGDPPDPRSIAAAARRGVDISDLRARQVRKADFGTFDLILGMDRQNVRDLLRIAPPAHQDRVSLFMQTALQLGQEVPDPYYDDDRAFDRVFDMCDKAAAALLAQLVP